MTKAPAAWARAISSGASFCFARRLEIGRQFIGDDVPQAGIVVLFSLGVYFRSDQGGEVFVAQMTSVQHAFCSEPRISPKVVADTDEVVSKLLVKLGDFPRCFCSIAMVAVTMQVASDKSGYQVYEGLYTSCVLHLFCGFDVWVRHSQTTD